MKSKFNKKSLIMLTIVMFIGTGVIPSISGYTGKTINQSTNEEITNFPFNEDYVNAYWKFDEGSGTTAGDSSGHDYDGTIYGASWTTGYSGYALDFDGVNDYIDFDDYAQSHLGFGKTDDLIFSFYFKSSLGQKGIIYSMCNGDYGYNPGFHIALTSSGKVEVQVWRLNCGILFSGTGNYNNNAWHEAEVYYNGITANPLVEVYVDGNLDSTYEKYVCTFFADQFKRAQMGRNSNDYINYFDGVIDEFKIIKYPGGNEQAPPIIDGPKYGDPSVEYDYSFITNDPEGDEILWIEIDWGNGDILNLTGPFESGEEVIVSYTWYEEDTYNIRARSKDYWHHSGWSNYPIIIGNRPPDTPTIDGPKSGNAGVIMTYKFVTNDFEEDDLLYYVEWGDGTFKDWFGPFPSGQEVTATHAWDEEDVYEIRAKSKDIFDKEGDWSDYYRIRIGNEQPTVPDINGPRTGKTGVEYDYSITSFDPNEDDIQYEINWGDGNTEYTNFNPSGEEAIASHTWTEGRTFTVKARAWDPFEKCSNWKEITVTIPRDRTFNFNLLMQLFERFPNAFPILRHLLEL